MSDMQTTSEKGSWVYLKEAQQAILNPPQE